MTNEQNFKRAKKLISKWPKWKLDFKLTKYGGRKMNNWISVKDEMPTENFKNYLCFRPDSTMDTRRVQMLKQGEFDSIYEVTHWMPLPEPPQK